MQLQKADAVRPIRRTADYPADAQFRWNTEILWAVDEYLQRVGSPERDEFLDAVRSGHMGLQALYTNPLTGPLRPEEMFRLTDCACRPRAAPRPAARHRHDHRHPRRELGHGAGAGARGDPYFSSGPNASDRASAAPPRRGATALLVGGPSGQDKLLYWVAEKGYRRFTRPAASRAPTRGRSSWATLTNWTRPATCTSWSSSATPSIPTTAPRISPCPTSSASGTSGTPRPVLVIDTADHLFAEFERRHGATLPAFAGDLTPYCRTAPPPRRGSWDWAPPCPSAWWHGDPGRGGGRLARPAGVLRRLAGGAPGRRAHLGRMEQRLRPRPSERRGPVAAEARLFAETADRLSRELLETVDAIEDAPAADAPPGRDQHLLMAPHRPRGAAGGAIPRRGSRRGRRRAPGAVPAPRER